MKQYRYEYRRNGEKIRTLWTADEDLAAHRMKMRIGEFHAPGKVAGDGDRNKDGSHPGCPRNGGLLSLCVRDDPTESVSR